MEMIDVDLHLWRLEQRRIERRIERRIQRAFNRRRPVEIQLPPPPPLVRQYAGTGTPDDPIDISSDNESDQAESQGA